MLVTVRRGRKHSVVKHAALLFLQLHHVSLATESYFTCIDISRVISRKSRIDDVGVFAAVFLCRGNEPVAEAGNFVFGTLLE